VGCESCHGPGKRHAFNPTKENIGGKLNPKACLRCHTPDHSPGFDRLEDLLWKEVDHSRKKVSFDQLIAQHSRGTLKPQLELFVMSFCPFGLEAERRLIPKVRKYLDKVDFKIYFIAERDEKAKGGELPFRSLHGKAEVVEDIRQVVIQRIFPEKFFDYLLCRAGNLREPWVKCARKVGIDVMRVNDVMESGEGLRWFEENIKRGNELGIRGSPTLLLNGRRISVWRVAGRGGGGLCE